MVTVAVLLVLIWHRDGYVSGYPNVWEMLRVWGEYRGPELGSTGDMQISLSISLILSGIVRELKWKM